MRGLGLQSGPIPATLGSVPLRITLGDDAPVRRAAQRPQAVGESVPPRGPRAPLADWGDPSAPPLLLFLSEEPEIGREFEYGGARWEIVDYQDGWIARLVVAP